jgi:hypothetical protein
MSPPRSTPLFIVTADSRRARFVAERLGLIRREYIVVDTRDSDALRRIRRRTLSEDDVLLISGWGAGHYAAMYRQEFAMRGVDFKRVRYE